MRILFVIPAYEPAWHLGGVVRCESLLARAMAAAGADVTVYTTDSGITGRLDVPVNQPLDVGGVKVWYFRTDFSLSRSYSRALASACRDTIYNYDVLYVVSFWCYPGLVACREARRQNIPYVMAPHGVFMPFHLKHHWMMKFPYLHLVEYPNLHGAAAIRYTTELERSVCQHLRLATPSFIVPNGVTLSEFQRLPSLEAAHQRLGLPPQARVVAYLGRLSHSKKLDIVVKAITRAASQIPDVHLILAGPDDGEEKSLRLLAQRLDMEGRVHFLGYVDSERRKDVFATASILILTSGSENFGMSAVEAMAAGVPVLASDQVGIKDTIEEDGAGMVVSVDADAVAAALLRMLSTPNGLREMGQRAAACARKRYDIRNIAQQMLQAFEDILTGQRSSGLGWSDHQPSIEAR